jgi:flagellar FliJ protein
MEEKFTLKRLLEVATATADSAAANLGALHAQLRRHEEKLLLLFKYRDEYQERLRRAAASGLDGAGLRNFHGFLERLEQAIMQQHAAIVEARTRVEGGRSDWQLKERKSKAFGTLEQRFDDTTRRHAARREQKLNDDFASRTNGAKYSAQSASTTQVKHRS